MPQLFHVSDEGPFTIMDPRPSPAGSPHEGREWVWAVDEERCRTICYLGNVRGSAGRLPG
ncbi:hypothetical protein GCM10010443_93280 [Actinoplanes cyaneus]